MVQLIPREGFDLRANAPQEQRLGDDYEYNMMRGTPYVMRRRMLLSPSRLPCTPPPFGTLVAIDLKTGGRLWEVPLGTMSRAVRSGHGRESCPTGARPISAARSSPLAGWCSSARRSIAAFTPTTSRPDASSGTASLPASAKATPMSYRLASGDQFVAIAVGGGGAWGAGDYVVAFKLRR